MREPAPTRVHVLVDLQQRPGAGGQVKVWERLAAAATTASGLLDLTIHFAGEAADARHLTDNVRFQTHRSIFSTARLPFLSDTPDHADLGRFHQELARALEGADVLHTTDAYFAFARTAERMAERRRLPLVTSIHTDTPSYTSVFTAATIEKLFGRGRLARFLNEGAALPRRAAARMHRRLADHQRRCQAVLVSRPEHLAPLGRLLSPQRVSLLRRGVDRAVFSPRPADRSWLENRFDIPAGRVVVLVVGRLDRGKNILTAVEAVSALVAEGLPLSLLCVGEGPERKTIFDRLGMLASCPGTLAPADLARVYAAVDLVAHPSTIEETSNISLEALACARPLLVAAESGSGRHITDGETGVVVAGSDPEAWTRALRILATDQALRARMGAAAGRWAERGIPTWQDVLLEDLLPVWQRVRGFGEGVHAAREAERPS
ncbi:MAG TPA: glycosyltransferase [Polyangia bacterium]|jgi:glycosyltransferase involved in cell wall biosynthesis|nr:glycosyltransferase [Polyangia bacterium]